MVDGKLATESGGVVAGVEIMVGGAEILTVNDAKVLMGAGKFNHKYIIA